jgi:thiamine transport system ATP-binding protein
MLVGKMLDIENIKFSWSDDEKFEFSLNVQRGETVTIEGPSGIGKSTLINLIAGFLKPESGKIFWCDERIDTLEPYKRPTSTIFQNDNLFEHLSCFDNVCLGISLNGKISLENSSTIDYLFNELGIYKIKDRMPREISGGQEARVSIVRALLTKKPILLLDEPVSSLDQNTREETLNLIKNTSLKHNLTLMIVSHHKDDRKMLNARKIKLS